MFQLCRLHVPCHHSHLSPSKLNSRTKVSQPLKRRHVAAPCCEPCQKNWQASLKPHIPRKQPFHTKISTNPSWTLPDSLVWNPLLPAKIVFIKCTCITPLITRCHTMSHKGLRFLCSEVHRPGIELRSLKALEVPLQFESEHHWATVAWMDIQTLAP